MSHGQRLRLGVYDQHFAERLPLDVSAVAYLRGQFDVTEQEARKRLGMFGLDGARHLINMSELSGGQKARCALSALALMQPHILVLDEP